MLAPHYARAMPRACGAHATPLRAAPDSDAPRLSELLPGEGFAVLEYAAGWAWGYCVADSLVGYVEAIALTAPVEATHVVCERFAPVAPDDNLVSPPLGNLPMGARLHGRECGACLTTEYGCVALSHLRRVDEFEEDPVAVAERLVGVPWLEGGRSPAGIDGPGLVQLSLSLCGIATPLLPDLLARLGEEVPQGAPLRRGDLVLYDGGAGLMIDDLMAIHCGREAGHVAVAAVATLGEGCVRRRLV